jgi:hypothetical protein
VTNAVKVSQTVGTIALAVRRVGSTIGPVSVMFATADGTAIGGTDYVAVAGTLSWGAGDGTSRTIAVPIVNRGGTVPDRAFVVSLTAPGGATLGTPSTETVTIHH